MLSAVDMKTDRSQRKCVNSCSMTHRHGKIRTLLALICIGLILVNLTLPLSNHVKAADYTTIVATSGTASDGIGQTVGNVELWAAQSFQETTGVLTQLTFLLDTDIGTPTGTLTW